VVASDDEGNAGDESGDEEEKKRKGKKAKKDKLKPTCEYNLYLQDDTNADSALFQWYYFAVMNIRADTVVRINIKNLSKPNGLYAKGMRPFVYSTNKQKQTGVGWHRGGENVSYFQNGQTARFTKKTLDAHWIGTQPTDKEKYKALHSLQFDYKFESDYDIVFFAHFVPYTYTDLVNFLCTLQAEPSHRDKLRLDYICNELGGAPLYGLTITGDIQTNYIPREKEILKFQKAELMGMQSVKPKKVKYLEPEKKKDNLPTEQALELEEIQSQDSSRPESLLVDEAEIAEASEKPESKLRSPINK